MWKKHTEIYSTNDEQIKNMFTEYENDFHISISPV